VHNKSEILPLTGLRFIAAIYVFVFHINYRWPIFSGGILKEIVSQGAVGMTIFFVLSGLLLAYQYSDRYEDRKHYFLRRLARIYPIYVVAAISTLPWIWGLRLVFKQFHGSTRPSLFWQMFLWFRRGCHLF